MSKKVTTEQVKAIADLAMIELTAEEIEKYRTQIEAILEYVDMLSEVDTDDLHFSSHIKERNVMREDEPSQGLTQEQATSNRKSKIVKGNFSITSVFSHSEKAS